MPTTTCSCGCETSADDHKMINCCVCKKSYFHLCADFSASEMRTVKSKKGVSYSCRNCNVVSNDINELRSAIISLKDEILSRERSNLSETLFEEILSEISERNNRKQNIILFNVAEKESQNADERKTHDGVTARSILQALPVDVDVERIEVHRLGRFVSGASRHRPIRVRLNSVADVHGVVKNVRHLGTSANFKNIRISLDKTKRQTDYYKKVKAELDARLADGESGLRLKYRGGIPKIETLN